MAFRPTDRYSMFHRSSNTRGYVVCTIEHRDRAQFETLGFADSVESLPVVKTRKRRVKKDGNSDKGQSSQRSLSTTENLGLNENRDSSRH